MSDNKPLILELIAQTINELAREIGIMDVHDPRRAPFLKKLSDLMQLRWFLRPRIDQRIGYA